MRGQQRTSRLLPTEGWDGDDDSAFGNDKILVRVSGGARGGYNCSKGSDVAIPHALETPNPYLRRGAYRVERNGDNQAENKTSGECLVYLVHFSRKRRTRLTAPLSTVESANFLGAHVAEFVMLCGMWGRLNYRGKFLH